MSRLKRQQRLNEPLPSMTWLATCNCNGKVLFLTSIEETTSKPSYGILAKIHLGEEFNLQVLKTRAGYYIGTQSPDGLPFSRESVEYWQSHCEANDALKTDTWTQKQEP